MPVVSPYSTHKVTLGKGVVSVMGATPASLVGVAANLPCWFADDVLVYQNYQSGAKLQTLNLSTSTTTTVSASGANLLGGGASVWAAQLAGVRTSVGGLGPFPTAYLAAVSELGQIAVVYFGSPSGITVYTAAGAVQFTVSVAVTLNQIRLRQNILSYQTSAGWQLVNVTTGQAVRDWKQRPNISYLVPFTFGSGVGVLEYDTSAPSTGALSVRPINSLKGLTIPTTGHEFYPDVQGVDDHDVRVAYSLGAGEARTELVILDIDTATRATQRGVVSGTSMAFSAGPTLVGAAFSGSEAASLALPIQSEPAVDLKSGTMTKPWRDALQGLNSTATSTVTAINNLPVVVPASSFGIIDTVAASIAGDVLAFTSADASITITPNQATQEIDFAVASAPPSLTYVPVSTGAEPLVLVSNGAGAPLLTPFTA